MNFLTCYYPIRYDMTRLSIMQKIPIEVEPIFSERMKKAGNEFTRAPAFDWDKLEELFKQKIFRLLLKEGPGRAAGSPKNSSKS
ncbi:MAG: hypothetical protein WA705_08465 [Candidatus Ozemobacteraceae bacterium]